MSKDISVGDVFGKWRVLSFIPGYRDGDKKYPKKAYCVCECGNNGSPSLNSLRKGRSKSCGCIGVELFIERNIERSKHGHAKRSGITKEYKAWLKIKERCYNKNNKDYHHYGGRGIKMHSTWINNYKSFYDHVGASPGKSYSIDRIDNNKGYVPGNLRWATQKQQINNSRIVKKKLNIKCFGCSNFFSVIPCYKSRKYCSVECSIASKARRI